MALVKNPDFNPADPTSQKFVFDDPQNTVINQTTGQTAAELDALDATAISDTNEFNVSGSNLAPTAPSRIFDLSLGVATLEKRLNEDFDRREKRIAEIDERLNDSTQDQENLTDRFTNFLTGRPSQRQILEEERGRLGVDEDLQRLRDIVPEIEAGRNQIAQLEEDKALAIEAEVGQGRGIPASIVSGRQAKIERQFNIRIAASAAKLGLKTATAEMLRGNISQARNIISETIEAELFDFTQRKKDFEDLFTLNRDVIDDLSDEQKSLLKEQADSVESELESRRDELSEIGELLMEFPNAGITFDDTIQEAQAKVAGVGGTSGGGSDRFTKTQQNDAAQKAGLPINQFIALPQDVQNFYINAPQKNIDQINSLIKDVVAGKKPVQEFHELIDNSNQIGSVKTYLKSLVDGAAPASQPEGNFFTRGWDAVKNFFSNLTQ